MKTQLIPETVEEARAAYEAAKVEVKRLAGILNRLHADEQRAICAKEGHDWHKPSQWFEQTCKRCEARR